MNDAFDRALAAISDRNDPDWNLLEAQMPSEDDRLLLRSLRDVARIGRGYSEHTARAERTAPFTWGPLHVLQWIARGAHGDVYRAWDPRLEREVALKLLRTTSAGEREVTAVAEGRLLARVHHPNVVSVYGADRIDGQAGVWMEFLAGRTLREEVEARGGLPPSEAIACAIDVCSALTAVHGARLIHRDVKAQNIIRTADGRTVLMDFGAGEDARTRPRGIEGTPVYLAPELLFGGAASRASEVYAVGVLLFFMLSCRYPAAGATIDEIKRVHESRAWLEPAAALRTTPALSAIINRALARRSEDRFPTAEALGAALQALVQAPAKRRSRFAAAASVLTFTVGAFVALAAADAHVGMPSNGPRRITMPRTDWGLPSRDGRRYPYIGEDGHIGYWQVNTDTAHVVAPIKPNTAFRFPIMSPDGALVAYTAALPDGSFALRATDAVRGESRQLILPETAYEPIAADWSADGSELLCWLRPKAGKLELVLLSVETGEMRPLYSVPPGAPPHAVLSPDGRFIVTVEPSQYEDPVWHEYARHGHLVLVPIDGSGPRLLLGDSGDDAFPSWLPDGHAILFLRPSASVKNSHDAWIARLDTDLRVEQMQLFQANAGSEMYRSAYTVSAAGDLQEFSDTRLQEVYVADFDAETGRVANPARIDPQRIGNHVAPAWSPDGGSIAFFSTTPAEYSGGNPLKTLTIKDVDTGRIRQLHPRLAFLGGYTPQWTRDGRAVVVWGRDNTDEMRTGYYIVDVLTGEARPFLVGGIEAPARSQFSPDGRHFLFNDNVTGIVSLDLATGERQLVLPIGTLGGVGRFAISPDGSAIALQAARKLVEGGWDSFLAVFRNGATRVIAHATAPDGLDLAGWTTDGRYVLYAMGRSSGGNPVFEVSPEGGPSRPTDLLQEFRPTVMSLSPDGRRVAYPESVLRTELRIIPLPRD
jgi:Tol biopolymer transport system component